MKIVSIVGARPQFIKLAPLSAVIRQDFKEVIVHTGQHYDVGMSQIFFDELGIPSPDYNLNIGSHSHGKQTAYMLDAVEEILLKEKPNGVVVFGDTNSTLAGAMATSKLGIPLFHVEAGLRSFNRTMPEETNRIIVDHISDSLFAPTMHAHCNLQDEGLGARTHLTGDIIVDSLKNSLPKIPLLLHSSLKDSFSLLTLHRPYNVDCPLKLIKILDLVSSSSSHVIFPVHPRTLKVLKGLGRWDNIEAVGPQGYLDFLALQSYATRIFTDSGGIQKEAYLLKTPCVTFRPETEWRETLYGGWNILIDPFAKNALEKIDGQGTGEYWGDSYGVNVANKMVKIIKEKL